MGDAPTLIVDFNRLDDDDVLWVPRSKAPRATSLPWMRRESPRMPIATRGSTRSR